MWGGPHSLFFINSITFRKNSFYTKIDSLKSSLALLFRPGILDGSIGSQSAPVNEQGITGNEAKFDAQAGTGFESTSKDSFVLSPELSDSFVVWF